MTKAIPATGVTTAAAVQPSRLFEDHLPREFVSLDFVRASALAECFKTSPDPLLAEMGGSRVEVAIGLDRNIYQLEVSMPTGSDAPFMVQWVKSETAMRRLKPGVAVPLAFDKVPVTLDAAISSLCETFGLCKERVVKAGVNLLAFWESIAAVDQLELPMSKDWTRYSLAHLAAGRSAVAL